VRLQGGWWPQSRDLTVELTDLTDHFPGGLGRVSRACISTGDWDSPPRAIAGDDGVVEVRALPREDPHVIGLRVSGRRLLRLLVVPPAMSPSRAEEAMLAATTARPSYTAASILEAVAESRDHDEFDEWHDTGGSYWDPNPLAPSHRPRA
jgi:hypothetical protein